MGASVLFLLGLPLDEDGMPFGFGVGREAYLRRYYAEREADLYAELFAMLEAGESVDPGWREEARRRLKAKRVEGPRRRSGPVTECETCGHVFVAFMLHGQQRFCSAPCQRAAWVKQEAERRAAEKASRPPLVCEECGTGFRPKLKRRARWCGAPCQKRAWRRRAAHPCSSRGADRAESVESKVFGLLSGGEALRVGEIRARLPGETPKSIEHAVARMKRKGRLVTDGAKWGARYSLVGDVKEAA